jgi:NAD(P)H-dependent FMN reductase
MKHILVVMGSVQPEGVREQVAAWLLGVASRLDGMAFELIDLKDWHLPFDDEPERPAGGNYVQPHTQAWSEKIKTGQGFVFLTSQHNRGYPAALKNALDHLLTEWKGKPAVIVSYGRAGGTCAAVQLRQVLTGLKMVASESMPALRYDDDMLDAEGRLANPAEAFAAYEAPVLDTLGDWFGDDGETAPAASAPVFDLNCDLPLLEWIIGRSQAFR